MIADTSAIRDAQSTFPLHNHPSANEMEWSAAIACRSQRSDEREVWLRCVVRPNRAQALLLDRLGLALPHRWRPTLPLATATLV